MELIFFYIFATLAVVTALGVVVFKNPISSAFSLVISFFAIAALYAMLSAHFIAVIQILVYAGAIMVLFIFVIMLLNLQKEELTERRASFLFKGTLVLFLGLFLGVLVLILKPLSSGFGIVDPNFGTVKAVGQILFTEYWFPFEYVSILLVVALIGGVVLAKKDL